MLANYPENKVRTILSQIGLPSQKAWSDVGSQEALLRELALIRNVLDECALSIGKKITETDFTK